jgi:hypothetical protein
MNLEKLLDESSIFEATHRSRRSMHDRRLDDKYEEFIREYEDRSRDRIRRAKFELDCESIDAERAAYAAGCRCERDGDVDAAMEWYYKAAASDFSDAAYRLATMLERKTESMIDVAGGQLDETGEEARERYRLFHALIAEVARWYAEASQAGHMDAPERLEAFLKKSQRMLSARGNRGNPSTASPPWECAEMRNHAASFLGGQLPENDAYRVREHLRTCASCHDYYLRANQSQVRDIVEHPVQGINRRFVKGLRRQGKAIAGLP